jgi:hypothetical protein
LGFQRGYACLEGVEGAGDLAVLGVLGEVEGDGSLAFEEGELDVVG